MIPFQVQEDVAPGPCGPGNLRFQLTLTLGFACNLACDYCYVDLQGQERLSPESASRALRLALDRLDPGGCLELGFFGGEPLLELDRMLEILQEAKDLARLEQKRVTVSVTSNGTLLTPVRLARLAEAGVRLTISCDGTARAHDRHRRSRSGAGSYAEVRAGLERALAQGLSPVVNMVITPENCSELAQGVTELASLGVNQFLLSPDYEGDWEPETMESLETQYFRLGELYQSYLLEGRPVALSFLEEKIQRAVRGGTRPQDRCAFGLGEMAVDPRGRIFPCERLVRDRGGDQWVIGELPEGIDPERLARLRGSLGTPTPDCAECGIRSLCTHWCGCVNLTRTGRAEEPDGLVCFLENLAIQVTEMVTGGLYPELMASLPGGRT